jgi:hypothetical protein
MIILISIVIAIFLGMTASTGRPYFLLLLPLSIPFSLALIVLSPWEEKPQTDRHSVAHQHHKVCRCRHHRDFEPVERKIELVVPTESSVDAHVTSGNNTVILQNL